MAVLGALYRNGEPPRRARRTSGAAAEHDPHREVPRRRRVRRPQAHASDGRQVLVDLTARGKDTLLADRARRDEWLATRLRELSPAERAVLRQAAPILERLARHD